MALTTLPTAAFASGSVGTAQLADGAVTTEKMKADVSFRNLIINGDMSISQRGTSQSGVNVSAYGQWCDRWNYNASSGGTWTISQSTDVPSGQGFASSLKMDCTTANASLGADNYSSMRTKLEAQFLQHLKYGTANAEALTLSFWVKSNKTGTYVIWFYNEDGVKSFSASYTISASSTWEKKTVSVPANTVGTITNNNEEGLRIYFMLAAGTNWTSGTLPSDWETDTKANRAVGQVNLADNTSNEWFLTGVQLEVGTSASDFEFLPYDINRTRCLRYYEKLEFTSSYDTMFPAWVRNGSDMGAVWQYETIKRANPTIGLSADNTYRLNTATGDHTCQSAGSSNTTKTRTQLGFAKSAAFTSGQAGYINMENGNGNAYFTADAEL